MQNDFLDTLKGNAQSTAVWLLRKRQRKIKKVNKSDRDELRDKRYKISKLEYVSNADKKKRTGSDIYKRNY